MVGGSRRLFVFRMIQVAFLPTGSQAESHQQGNHYDKQSPGLYSLHINLREADKSLID